MATYSGSLLRTRRCSLDSHFKCHTEVGGECLDWGAVAEALPRRGVEVPGKVVDVGIGVVRAGGLAGRSRRSRPFAFSIEPRCHGLCGSQKEASRPMASVTASCRAKSPPLSWGDGAARSSRQSARFCDDGFCGEVGALLRRHRASVSRERLSCSVRRMSRWLSRGNLGDLSATIRMRDMAVAATVSIAAAGAASIRYRQERRVHHLADFPQRMVRSNPRFQIDIGEQLARPPISTPHRNPVRCHKTVIPAAINHDTCAQARLETEVTRAGSATKSFQAWQQASTTAS